MSAVAPTSPYDPLGLEAPFAERFDETDGYEAAPTWNELGESPFAEAAALTEGWNEDPGHAGEEQLAWLDMESENDAAHPFAEDLAFYGDGAHEHAQEHDHEWRFDGTAGEAEYLDDEERDANESHESYESPRDGFEPAYEAGIAPPAPLTASQHAWVMDLERSAIERLPNAAMRTRFLQQGWADIEVPGNEPKGLSATSSIMQGVALANSLFAAMAKVVPERRVPTSIRFSERPVVKVPGQPSHRLYAEACDAFLRMHAAAKTDGVDLVILSSWRSAARQAKLRAQQPNANLVAAKASAHMYGLAIDLRMSVPGLPVLEMCTRGLNLCTAADRADPAKRSLPTKMGNLVRMYRSPVYKWLSLRAREFGWYPFKIEPWHWEYNPPGLKARFEGGELEREANGESTESSWQEDQERSPQAEAAFENGGTESRFLRTFTAKALGVKVSVFVTRAARAASQVEMLVFAHGFDRCPPHFKGHPKSLITGEPFRLGELVEATGRPIVLVVPHLDWEQLAGNKMGFGPNGKWHKLAQPKIFNRVASEVLEQVRALTGSSTAPALQRLILAGHSKAYGFFDPLASAHAAPEMRQGALGRLTHVWALDTTYGSWPIPYWKAWLRSRNDFTVCMVYRYGKCAMNKNRQMIEVQTGTPGEKFKALATEIGDRRMSVIDVPCKKVGHCEVPTVYLPIFLNALPAASAATPENEETFAESEDQAECEDYEFEDDSRKDAYESDGESTAEIWRESEDTEAEGEPERFDELGDARDSEWEANETGDRFDEALDLEDEPASFAGELEEHETSVASSGLSAAELKAVEITSTFETGKRGGFHGLSGNFDGQGLSFGLVNWTIGTGSLQPLLRDFAREHPARWAAVFGTDAESFRQLILRKDKQAREDQRRFAIEQMNNRTTSAQGKPVWTVRQPWVGYFKRLSEDTEFRKIQVRYVRDLLATAEGYCRQFSLKSEQSFTFMFDAVSSHGKWWLTKKFDGMEKRRTLVEERLKALVAQHGEGKVPESEMLLAIADVLGATSAQRWARKVRQRKRWFVTGQHPRSKEFAGLRPRPDIPYSAPSPAQALSMESPRPTPDAGLLLGPTAIDERAAQPMFPQRARDRIERMLAAKEVSAATTWNLAQHPKISGIPAADLRARLDRYLNSAAIAKAMLGDPGLRSLSSDPNAVLAVLAHQFQQKIYAVKPTGDSDRAGRIGEGTLDALGFVRHRGDSLNRADAVNVDFHVNGRTGAYKRLEEEYKKASTVFSELGTDVSPKTWYRLFVSAPFLGRPFKNGQGIHAELMRRLRLAEKWLLEQPQYRDMSPAELGKTLGLTENHGGGRPKATSSMHTLGLAIDIGYVKNPWVAGKAGSPRSNRYFQEASRNVARLLNGIDETLTPAWLSGLGTDPARSTGSAYNEIRKRHDNLKGYLSLESDPRGLETTLRQRGQNRLVFSPGESIESASKRWRETIKGDRARLKLALVPGRVPSDGFLNLHRDLVIALRDHACLAWGAIDLGTSQSGDVMHFDCRANGIGWRLALKRQRTVRGGHPCLGRSPTTGMPREDEALASQDFDQLDEAEWQEALSTEPGGSVSESRPVCANCMAHLNEGSSMDESMDKRGSA